MIGAPAPSRSGRASGAVLGALLAGGTAGAVVALSPGGRALAVSIAVVAGLLVLGGRAFRPSEPSLWRWVAGWTVASFLLHLAIGVVVSATPSLVDYLGPDARTYDTLSWEVASHWREGSPMPTLAPGKEGFFYLLAGVYYVVGHHIVAGLVLNAGCAAALVFISSDTTRRLFGSAASRPVAPLVTLLPGFLLWPSLLLREATILLLIAIAANLAVRMSGRLRPSTLVTLAVVFGLLFANRANVAALMTVGVVAGMVVARRTVVASVGTAAMVGLTVVAVVLVVGIGYTGYRLTSETDLEQVQRVRTGLSLSAETSYGESVEVTSPGQIARYLPEAGTYFALGPFPWQVDNSRQAPLLLDAVVMVLLVPSLVRGIRAGGRVAGRRIMVLLAPAVLLLVMLALLVTNFGLAVRERPQVVLLVLPVVAYGWSLRARWRPAPGAGGGAQEEAAAPSLRDRR